MKRKCCVEQRAIPRWPHSWRCSRFFWQPIFTSSASAPGRNGVTLDAALVLPREKPEDTPYRGSPRLRSSPSRPATANGWILLAKFGPLSSCRMASAREAPVHASKECEVTPSRWQHARARRLAGVAPIGWSTAAAPCLRRRNLVPFLLGDGPTTKQPCDDLCGGGLGPCPTHFNAA